MYGNIFLNNKSMLIFENLFLLELMLIRVCYLKF